MTADEVEQALIELERRKRLFRWKQPDGKEWGHLVGGHKFMPDFSQLNDPRRPNGTHHALGAWIPLRKLARFSGEPYGELLEEFAKRLGGPYLTERSEFRAKRGSRVAATRRRPRRDQVAEGLDLIGKEKIGFRLEQTPAFNSDLPASSASPPTAAPPLPQEDQKGAALGNAPTKNSFLAHNKHTKNPLFQDALEGQGLSTSHLLTPLSQGFEGLVLHLTLREVEKLLAEFRMSRTQLGALLLHADDTTFSSGQRVTNAYMFARDWLRRGGGS